jgi:hypothetical protein
MLSLQALQLISNAFTNSNLAVPVQLCDAVGEIKAWVAAEISSVTPPPATE